MAKVITYNPVESTTARYQNMAVVPGTQFVVMVYQSISSLEIKVGERTSTGVNWGTPQAMAGVSSDLIKLTISSSSKGIIAFRDLGNSNYTTAIVFDFDTSLKTATPGLPYVIKASGNFSYLSVEAESELNFVIYYDSAQFKLCSIVGTTITAGTEYTLSIQARAGDCKFYGTRVYLIGTTNIGQLRFQSYIYNFTTLTVSSGLTTIADTELYSIGMVWVTQVDDLFYIFGMTKTNKDVKLIVFRQDHGARAALYIDQTTTFSSGNSFSNPMIEGQISGNDMVVHYRDDLEVKRAYLNIISETSINVEEFGTVVFTTSSSGGVGRYLAFSYDHQLLSFLDDITGPTTYTSLVNIIPDNDIFIAGLGIDGALSDGIGIRDIILGDMEIDGALSDSIGIKDNLFGNDIIIDGSLSDSIGIKDNLLADLYLDATLIDLANVWTERINIIADITTSVDIVSDITTEIDIFGEMK